MPPTKNSFIRSRELNSAFAKFVHQLTLSSDVVVQQLSAGINGGEMKPNEHIVVTFDVTNQEGYV